MHPIFGQYHAALGLLLALVLLPTVALAQSDVELSSHVDRETLNPGDSLTYEVNVSVEGHFNIEMTQSPGFDDFSVHGRMTAPSYRVINGRPHRSLRREYRMRAPSRPGTYTITAPTFRIGDRQFSPDDITVEVVGDGRARQAPDDTGGDRADRRAFAEVSLDPDRNPYVGEQVTIDYLLYIQRRERNLRHRFPDQPALDGFWIEDLRRQVRRHRSRERRYGTSWNTTPLYTYAAFPLSAGPTEIDSLRVELERSSIFDADVEKVVESDPVVIDVLPLPDGAPDGFSSGNVGSFTFDVHLGDTGELAAGGQFRLSATIEGEGRIDRIGPPTFDVSDDFRVLSTDDSYDVTLRQRKLGGQRTFEYRLMPLEEGRRQLPALQFTYFDPDRAEYVTLSSDPIELDVAPGDVPILSDSDDLQRASTPEEVDPLAELRGLFPPGTFSATADDDLPFAPWALAIPLTGLLLLLFGPWLGRPVLRRLSPTFRRRTLRRRIDDELHGDGDVPSRCLRALQICLRDGLKISVGALTTDDVASALVDTDLPKDLSEEVTELVDRLVQRRYAPEQRSSDDDGLVEETAATISRLLKHRFGNSDKSRDEGIKASSILLIGACTLVAATVSASAPGYAADSSNDDDLYTAESAQEWAEHAEEWARRAQEDPGDPTLHYNAGTAFIRAEEPGMARLHLERALIAAPDEAPIRHNLRVLFDNMDAELHELATYPEYPLARSFHARAPHVLIALLWLAFAIAALRLATGRPRSRAAFASLLTTVFVCTGVVATLWIYIDSFPQRGEVAIVTVDDAWLHRAPSALSEPVSADPLPPASSVLIHDIRDGWLDVELPSGHNGWLKSDAAEPVIP